ncbi:MAG TPA: hypothetical protein VHL56_05470 [Candidatus Limnocylindrales bacterium]|jgi:hypothetical protein|nr:hypothetical protein [Candidatus Limnocylindrales bacterium]
MAKRTKFQHKPAALRPGPRSATPSRPAASPGSSAATTRPAARPATIADEPLPVDLPDDAPMRGSASNLTDAEEQRAAAFEAQLRAQEKAALTEELRRKARAQDAADAGPRGDVNAPLAVRMAHEYAYVARDVKRIALTAGLMVAILAVLEILVNVTGIITL